MYVRGIKIPITGNHFILGNVPSYAKNKKDKKGS